MEKTTIEISGRQYTVKQSFRALMLFEEMTNKSVNQINESVNDLLKLFYCILKGNNLLTFEYTFDNFIDIIDEHPEAFQHFNDYLATQAKGQPEQTAQKKSAKK